VEKLAKAKSGKQEQVEGERKRKKMTSHDSFINYSPGQNLIKSQRR